MSKRNILLTRFCSKPTGAKKELTFRNKQTFSDRCRRNCSIVNNPTILFICVYNVICIIFSVIIFYLCGRYSVRNTYVYLIWFYCYITICTCCSEQLLCYLNYLLFSTFTFCSLWSCFIQKYMHWLLFLSLLSSAYFGKCLYYFVD